MSSTITASEAIQNVKNLKSDNIFRNKSKATIKGSFIGFVAGGMIGYYKNYNLFVSCATGTIIGGIITYYFLNIENSNPDNF